METLRIRRLADKSEEALANHPAGHPDTYPSRGLDFVDDRGRTADPPQSIRVSTGTIDKLRAQGEVVLVGENVVHRPGGPPGDLWRVTHTFKQADKIVFKTHDGRDNVTYKVVHQPDKYVDTTDYSQEGPYEVGTEPTPKPTAKADAVKVTSEIYGAGQTRVDWFYDLELEA